MGISIPFSCGLYPLKRCHGSLALCVFADMAAIIFTAYIFGLFLQLLYTFIAFIHCILLLYMEIYLSTAFKGRISES